MAAGLRCACTGMTLIEVLVALLLMSTGLVGAAALHSQHIAARGADARQLRAIRLSADLIDRLRVLPPGVRDTPAGGGRCDSTRICPPAALAASLRAGWQNRVGRELPGGTGSFRLGAGGTSVTVELRWADPGGPAQLRTESGL